MLAGKTAFSNSRKGVGAIGIVSVIPIALGLAGLFFMQVMETVIAVTLALSAGGIFYMLFYDMIPKDTKSPQGAQLAAEVWLGARLYHRVCLCPADWLNFYT